MSTTNKILAGFIFMIASLAIVACENEDNEKLLAAQICYNKLDDATAAPGAAQACFDKLGNLQTPEAQLLRCGMTFWEGGLTTTKVVTSFDAYDAAPANQKEATLIYNLSLTDTTLADEAYGYCKQGGAAGMMYIASLVKLGTYMAAVGGSDPASAVDNCIGNGACATPENGQMLIDMAGLYCQGDSTDDPVCVALNTAIQGNENNPQAVIDIFLGQIDITP